MAITTYSELQSAVENWLDHQLFTSRVPEFIALFEATANRKLRVRQQETSATVVMTDGSGTLPTDYLAWRRVFFSGSSETVNLEYMHPDATTHFFPTEFEGTPRYFGIIGDTLFVRPIPSSSDGIIMTYFAKIPSLSASATTNWLLTAHPDLYLFGSLVEAEGFGVNDNRIGMWKARRDEIFDEIEKLSNKTRGIGPIWRLDFPTP